MKTVTLAQTHEHAGVEYPAGAAMQLPDDVVDYLVANVPGTVVAEPPPASRRSTDRTTQEN